MRYRWSLLLILFVAVSVFASDWPQWRGPNRDGVSLERGLLSTWPEGGPKLLWNAKDANKDAKGKNVGDGYGFEPRDRRQNASTRWARRGTRRTRRTRPSSSASIAAPASVLWSTKVGDTAATTARAPRRPSTSDRVYGVTNAGPASCPPRFREGGTIVWSKDYVKDFAGKSMAGWHFCESPLIDGDKLICTPGGLEAGLVALDKKTGEVPWQSPVEDKGGAGYASVMPSDGGGVHQYVTFMSHDKGLVGVDAKTGKLLWNYRKVANGTGNISTVIVKGDLVFASTGYGTGSSSSA